MHRISLSTLAVVLIFTDGCGSKTGREVASSPPAQIRVYDAVLDSSALWVAYLRMEGDRKEFRVSKLPLADADNALDQSSGEVKYSSELAPSRVELHATNDNLYILHSGQVPANEKEAAVQNTQSGGNRTPAMIVVPKKSGSPRTVQNIPAAINRCFTDQSVLSLAFDGQVASTSLSEDSTVTHGVRLPVPKYPLNIVCDQNSAYVVDGVLAELRELRLKEKSIAGPRILDSKAIARGRTKFGELYKPKENIHNKFTPQNSKPALLSGCRMVAATKLHCLVNGFSLLDSAWIVEVDMNAGNMTASDYVMPLHAFITTKDGKPATGIRKMTSNTDYIAVVTIDGKTRLRKTSGLARL
ncbi:MAG TPA: hypothetical protein VFQ91_08040 [Bryobacteraceae bacterium]|nr:hypothetical protein [Bryobacteraceae bacterium]